MCMVIEMVKNKYLSMSCEERKKARSEYFATEEGRALKSRVNRLVVYSFLLVVFGIYVIIDAINIGDTHLQLFYGIGLIIVAAVFFIGRYFVIIKMVNDYLIDNVAKVSVKAEKKEEVKKEVKVVEEKKEEAKKPAPQKKTTATPKKATPAKKAEPAKKVAPAKKTAPVKKAAQPKKATPAKKSTAAKPKTSKATTKKAK